MLSDFLAEREFWQQLGLSRADLQSRPHREIADYALIIQMIRREENRRNGPR